MFFLSFFPSKTFKRCVSMVSENPTSEAKHTIGLARTITEKNTHYFT